MMALAVPAGAQERLICAIDEKFHCDRGQGCQRISSGGFYNIIDLERRTFARCDNKGCDEYPANFTLSGLFMNIELSRGAMAKLDPGMHLFEVATLWLGAWISYGTVGSKNDETSDVGYWAIGARSVVRSGSGLDTEATG
ncbi:MAG TPA: hypothetical protein VHJ58_16565 [Vicinamibacterales bacterium]|nr:hypothetical protein [Vicinamibacterales bacterium]